MDPSNKRVLLLIGFLGFFAALLSPIPLSGSILGSVDSMFIPAISNTYLNRLEAIFTGEPAGQSLYPADIARYGESGIGLAATFILLRLVGASNVLAQYLVQVLMLALMAYAMFLFSRHFTNNSFPAVVAGLGFGASNFLWANVDDLPIHFYFLPLIAGHLVMRAYKTRRPRDLVLGGVIGGLQVYASGQVFAYQTILITILVLFHFRQWWQDFTSRTKIAFVAAYLLIPLPRILYYLNTVFRLELIDVWPMSTQMSCYFLQLPAFLTSLPGKLISYGFVDEFLSTIPFTPFCDVRQSAFIGLMIPLLAAGGLIVAIQNRDKGLLALFVLSVVGVILALGPSIVFAGNRFVSPVALFYQYVPLSQFLRVGLRSYSLSILGLSVLAATGLDHVYCLLKRRSRILAVITVGLSLLVVLGENISWPLNRYETIPYPSTPPGYKSFFADKPEAVILDLPALSHSWPGYMDEIRYVLWQTDHKRNIVGGVTGYYPVSRVEMQHYTDQLPSDQAFRYLQELGVTHLIWHDSPHLHSVIEGTFMTTGQISNTGEQLPGRDYEWLRNSPWLTKVFENDEMRIFRLHNPASSNESPGPVRVSGWD